MTGRVKRSGTDACRQERLWSVTAREGLLIKNGPRMSEPPETLRPRDPAR